MENVNKNILLIQKELNGFVSGQILTTSCTKSSNDTFDIECNNNGEIIVANEEVYSDQFIRQYCREDCNGEHLKNTLHADLKVHPEKDHYDFNEEVTFYCSKDKEVLEIVPVVVGIKGICEGYWKISPDGITDISIDTLRCKASEIGENLCSLEIVIKSLVVESKVPQLTFTENESIELVCLRGLAKAPLILECKSGSNIYVKDTLNPLTEKKFTDNCMGDCMTRDLLSLRQKMDIDCEKDVYKFNERCVARCKGDEMFDFDVPIQSAELVCFSKWTYTKVPGSITGFLPLKDKSFMCKLFDTCHKKPYLAEHALESSLKDCYDVKPEFRCLVECENGFFKYGFDPVCVRARVSHWENIYYCDKLEMYIKNGFIENVHYICFSFVMVSIVAGAFIAWRYGPDFKNFIDYDVDMMDLDKVLFMEQI